MDSREHVGGMFHVEHPYVFVSVLFFGTLLHGVICFWLGQRSVRLVGQRVETVKSSDSRIVEEWAAVQPGKVQYAPGSEPATTLFVPPRYRDLVTKYQKEEGN